MLNPFSINIKHCLRIRNLSYFFPFWTSTSRPFLSSLPYPSRLILPALPCLSFIKGYALNTCFVYSGQKRYKNHSAIKLFYCLLSVFYNELIVSTILYHIYTCMKRKTFINKGDLDLIKKAWSHTKKIRACGFQPRGGYLCNSPAKSRPLETFVPRQTMPGFSFQLTYFRYGNENPYCLTLPETYFSYPWLISEKFRKPVISTHCNFLTIYLKSTLVQRQLCNSL